MIPPEEESLQGAPESGVDEVLISLRRDEKPSTRSSISNGSMFAPGDLLGNRFRVLNFIDRGGMGEVYEAEDLELSRKVALKTILVAEATAPVAIAQLKQEVQIACQVTHPNVSRIFDIGFHKDGRTQDGTWFVTMELLQGRTLFQEIAQKGKLSQEVSRVIISQLAAGLNAIHGAGIIHGDFKSGNVLLVDRPDGHIRAVITDFGLAVQRTTGDQSSGAGTALYMAPEQVQRGTLTPRTDIYSLGVVLYEMVTGNWPFFATTAEATARKRLTDKPVLPTRYTPELDPIWTRTILRCLAVEPAERFPSALDVARELRVRRFYESRWFWLAAIVIAAVSLSFAAAWFAELGPFRVPPSVAVLGWNNASGSPQYDWIATEISERLTSLLANNKRLAVIPQQQVAIARLETSLETTVNLNQEDLNPLRAALSGSSLIFGEYQIQGGVVRVRGELQDAFGRVQDSFEESDSEQDIEQLAAKIAVDLAPVLKLSKPSRSDIADLRQIYPTDTRARSLYFSALDKLRSFRVVEARDSLLQAAAIDANSVAIRLALADSWSKLKFDLKARAEAARASQLANEQRLLPEYVQAVAARQAEFDGHWENAAEKYEQLNRSYPTRPEYLLSYVRAQIEAGRPKLALDRLGRLKPRERQPMGEAAFHLLQARAYEITGDFQQQLEFAKRSLEIAKSNGERLQEAQAQKEICWAERSLGQPEAALNACDLAQNIFNTFNDFVNAAVVLNRMAVLKNDQGDYEGAQAAFQKIAKIVGDAGSQVDLAGALLNLATTQIATGDLKAAEANLRSSLEVGRPIEDRSDEVRARISLASVLTETDRVAEASVELQRSLSLARQLGDRDLEATALSNLGQAALDADDLDSAESMLRQSLALRETLHEPSGIAKLKATLGDIARRRGHADEAKRDYTEALAVFDQLESHRDSAEARLQLATLAADHMDYQEALEKARAADVEFSRAHDAESQVQALVLTSLSEAAIGDIRAAEQTVQQARTLGVNESDLMEQIDIAEAITWAANGRVEQAKIQLQRVQGTAGAAGRTENALEAELALLRLQLTGKVASGETSRAVGAFQAKARGKGFENLAQIAGGLSNKKMLPSQDH